MPFETTCMTYSDWKHPMEFLTLITFPLATIYMLIWAVHKHLGYLIFALIAFGISILVYYLSYYPKICWNTEEISYIEGDNITTIKWEEVQTIGGFVRGRYGSRYIDREELVKPSNLTTKHVYISTKKIDPTVRQFRNTEWYITFQYRKGILEEMERLAGLRE